ncbi:hypothetical protein [Chitinophaga silvisoli]|uniref:Uncharacterized protein n=1 Tax=Chitinophaga silvisoli TaxID=2291814 RepID=A0A3E1P2J6_9BACT|nr:hypothetical protein [Chitinophaga silvisoli]RFM34423.1 hypothetical protein DXN04_14170 [Chitinophaga silvisoli]
MAKITLEQLDKLGLQAARSPLDKAVQEGRTQFAISFHAKQGKDDMIVYLTFHLLPDLKTIDLTHYEVLIKLPIVLAHGEIGGIDTAALEQKISEIDWSAPVQDTDSACAARLALAVQLYELEQAGQEGYSLSKKLQVKYFTGTPFAVSIAGDFRLKSLSKNYYPSQSFQNHFPSLKEAHSFMRHELKIKGWHLAELPAKKAGRSKKQKS